MSRQVLNVHVEWIHPYSFKCYVPRESNAINLGTQVVGGEALKLLRSLGVAPDSFEQLHNIGTVSAILAYNTFNRLLELYGQQPEPLKVTVTLDDSQPH